MRSIVVTGVGSGIGCATAKFLIEKGWRVFGSVRRAEQGAELAHLFGRSFVSLVFDVRDEAAVAAAAERVRCALRGETLAGLINNAGTATSGPLLQQSLDEIRLQLDTNLMGPFIVTKAFAPLLGADPSLSGTPGRVINMSSLCGRIGSPFATAYCASKHGLEGFSESLRRELMVHRIPVIIVAPGLTKTPFWTKIADRTLARVDATPFGPPFRKGMSILTKTARKHGMEPRRVAEAVWHALTVDKPRFRYAPTQHPILERGLTQALPRWFIDRLIDRRVRLSPRTAADVGRALPAGEAAQALDVPAYRAGG